MKKIIALWLIFLLPTVLIAQANQNRSVVFKHVTVIDVKNARTKSDMTVIVAGNRITAIGKTGKVRVGRDAEIIDARGKFLIPGLWDMHVHALTDNRYEWVFPMLIAQGVTGIRELGNNLPIEQISLIRREILEGKLLGPRFGAATARILDGAGTTLNVATAVETSEKARAIVRDYKRQGVDFIKPYNLLSREVYLAIADESKRLKIPVEGHVPFSMSAREVSDLGQITIEHNADIFMSCSRDEEKLREELKELVKTLPVGARQQIETKAARTFDERRANALFKSFVDNDTWMCPTIIVNSVPDSESPFEMDARLKYIPARMQERWRGELKQRRQIVPSADDRKMRQRKRLEIVGLMQRAGVRLIAGSDTPNLYVYPGFSLHDELELLVQAGLTPAEALQTATINAARFFGKETTLGTIEKGKLADLVLLDANPLEDIKNTTRIAAVVANGKYFSKSELEKLLAQAEKAAGK
ncbi:MAG TPA: amidohydrolase family protein [Pyrinomonadaceae bacterium]